MMETETAGTEILRQAMALHQTGRLGEAQSLYDEILSAEPAHFDALHLSGVLAGQAGQPDRALALIEAALAVDPNSAVAYLNRGLAQESLGQLHAALDSFAQAIERMPDFAQAFCSRGIAFMKLAQWSAALDCLERALALQADFAEAHDGRGAVLRQLGRREEALQSLNRALACRPGMASALNNRCLVLRELGDFAGALASADQAISVQPDFAEAFHNRGGVLKSLRLFPAALDSYDRAIALKPQLAAVHSDRGNLLAQLRQFEAAQASFDRAIALDPNFADAYANRANVLREQNRYEEAIADYDVAMRLGPTSSYIRAARLFARMHLCAWQDFEAELMHFRERVAAGAAAALPFCILSQIDSAALQKQVALSWSASECPPKEAPQLRALASGREANRRMRIGYFSSDCHDHATMFLMAGLFEEHDRTRFEVTVFSFGLASQDAMRQRLLAGVERFIDVREKSDQEVVALARSLELDIAVDLKGFTSGARTELFALRVAPIQVSYLGYPGTMGVPYMEYLIADHTLIPAPSRVHYSEKVVYLPDSYQVNDSRRAIAARVFTREQVGLPAQGFVFCCFNNSYKILPAVFDVWMRLLQRVPGSVLWLLQDNAGAMQNLYQEAQRRGVDPSRLVFATRLGHSEHLSRQRLADLFLDTLPYNAHTTASDALWSGLPVLTCMGESFAARVGASLLKAVGLPELISENLAQYEALAVQLASQPQRLAALRERLAANRATAALFDTRRFTRNLERAYAQILQRHRDGLPPDHIEVAGENPVAAAAAARNAGLFRQAMTLHEQGKLTEAESLYNQVLRAEPGNTDCLHMLGVMELQRSHAEKAVSLIATALQAQPRNPAMLCNYGNALAELGRHTEALDCYDKSIALAPELPETHNNRGNALRRTGRHEAAIESYERAIELRPDYAEAYDNRGTALFEMRLYAEAMASHECAIAFNPHNPESHYNCGNAHYRLSNLTQALQKYADALTLDPRHLDSHNGRGVTFATLKQYAAAVECFDRAIEIKPDLPELYFNRGNSLSDLKQYEQAVLSYDRALAGSDRLKYLHGARLHAKTRVCDWRNFDAELAELIARLERNFPAAIAFPPLALFDSPALHRRLVELFVQLEHPPLGASAQLPALASGREANRRMRIGYFSSDCHDHATMFLMAGLFEEHDRTRFEVTVFSFGLASQDAMRQRLLAGVERFIDVREKSDQEVVALARSLELDIAVDLKGFTSGARTELFALRVAPIQVSYLGYPGTMGVPYMEYLIADHTLIPAPSRVHYSEKVVYLPDSYQVNDSRRAIAARVFTREQVGLPAQGFVFCCFNNSYKILPAVFDVWMRLLQRVPGSVLWLLQDNAGAMQNLYQEAQRRGVDPSRLVFATRLGHSEHLSRQRLADLFLDTLPYNAHTTASDALWSGLPVLTCMGESFAARVGASLLKAVGLPELISENLAQYEALAVQLASQPQRLAALRERLAANRATAALFDTRRFTRNLERAYAQILQRHRDGLPPDHIEVGSEP